MKCNCIQIKYCELTKVFIIGTSLPLTDPWKHFMHKTVPGTKKGWRLVLYYLGYLLTLQLEIVGLPIALALANYLYTQNFYGVIS